MASPTAAIYSPPSIIARCNAFMCVMSFQRWASRSPFRIERLQRPPGRDACRMVAQGSRALEQPLGQRARKTCVRDGGPHPLPMQRADPPGHGRPREVARALARVPRVLGRDVLLRIGSPAVGALLPGQKPVVPSAPRAPALALCRVGQPRALAPDDIAIGSNRALPYDVQGRTPRHRSSQMAEPCPDRLLAPSTAPVARHDHRGRQSTAAS